METKKKQTDISVKKKKIILLIFILVILLIVSMLFVRNTHGFLALWNGSKL